MMKSVLPYFNHLVTWLPSVHITYFHTTYIRRLEQQFPCFFIESYSPLECPWLFGGDHSISVKRMRLILGIFHHSYTLPGVDTRMLKGKPRINYFSELGARFHKFVLPNIWYCFHVTSLVTDFASMLTRIACGESGAPNHDLLLESIGSMEAELSGFFKNMFA